ncbi:MAG: COR domain-containing protein [Anaerolineales bacterium]
MPHDSAYLQAEKKITEALKSGKVSFFFRATNLTELPELLWKHIQLRDLHLSSNQLKELPEGLGELSQLVYLDLSYNQLIALPQSIGKLMHLERLDLSYNRLTKLPESIGKLMHLERLDLTDNQITSLPASMENLTQLDMLSIDHNRLMELPLPLRHLTQLKILIVSGNNLTTLPEWLENFTHLEKLSISNNQLTTLPNWLGNLKNLAELTVESNKLLDIPHSLAQLDNLRYLRLDKNPLNPELTEAYKQDIKGVKAYLRASSNSIVINEAKLILIGEGEVGKTCLMDALLGNEWQEHPSTHGIEIQQVKVVHTETQKEITLNGWDFGGQRVYRPTHQLFFSAPAVYLVVWKPREGPQQGFVREWIQLVKRREPSAKIIVVATHGGPQQRQPDIDRQELWDIFGKDTVVDFFWVDSKPDKEGNRKGIEELKEAIARVAAELPEVGRSVPKSFADARAALQSRGLPYLQIDEVLAICHTHNMDDEIARLFITISHRLGHLTHYENDPTLRDIVILRPDWLANAMSYIFDDEETRTAHGLVKFSRLSQLWNNPERSADTRYNESLHRIFLRLMERFDLSYRVAGLSKDADSDPISLIAQLVPDTTPTEDTFTNAWHSEPAQGDIQQTQICRIVDSQSGQSANAEGLFYQLIVRLHRYSLGRSHYNDSVHWQRGLILDADYNGRALIRHIGNDVHITVRAPYPDRFLGMLTEEVKYLVESFWEGLRCDVTVPCLNPNPCAGLFEVEKLIENKKRERPEMPCQICNEWQNIDKLLLNAPAAYLDTTNLILSKFTEIKADVEKARLQISYLGEKTMKRFDGLDERTRRTLSIVDKTYSDLIQLLTDEAKEGPRLFSLIPVKRSSFNPKEWASEKFRLILWCEHSRLPLPLLNGRNSSRGIYDLEFSRDWFKKSAPFLSLMTNALNLALPIAVAGAKIAIDKIIYEALEDYFTFGKEVIDASLSASEKNELWKDKGDDLELSHGVSIRAENATLRELQSFLKEKDPGFGGLVRVMNKRQEFLWVHEKFASEY